MSILGLILIFIVFSILHYICLYLEIRWNSDLFYDLYIAHDYFYFKFKKIIKNKKHKF